MFSKQKDKISWVLSLIMKEVSINQILTETLSEDRSRRYARVTHAEEAERGDKLLQIASLSRGDVTSR